VISMRYPSSRVSPPLLVTASLVAALLLLMGAPRDASAQSSGSASRSTVTAKCKDGTTYSGESRKGACSGHGGVKSWGDGSSAPRPKGATAQCEDGSWYTKSSRKGACAGHGGVKEWIKD
jgi:Protein of unknown function (DUF3761)